MSAKLKINEWMKSVIKIDVFQKEVNILEFSDNKFELKKKFILVASELHFRIIAHNFGIRIRTCYSINYCIKE